MEEYSVTELNDYLKKLINTEFKYKDLIVTGEVSNLKPSGNNTYLTLKDRDSTINVVFWGVKLDNSHGDNVNIVGRLDYYTRFGSINLIGKTIENKGIGVVHAEYEKIKKDYDKKGYFTDRRQNFPKKITKIGVVTSQNGAAIQDFMYVLESSGFSGEVYIYDCSVQGVKCPSTVASGIKFFNSPFFVDPSKTKVYINTNADSITNNDELYESDESIQVDVIVITRGGGSFEDLMGFSHPKVIESIYASNVYTISAVGHEIDEMLSDYVANYRAPTPSIAGEVICTVNAKDQVTIKSFDHDIDTIKNNLLRQIVHYKNRLMKIKELSKDPNDIIEAQLTQTMTDMIRYIKISVNQYISRYQKLVQTFNIAGDDITKSLDQIVHNTKHDIKDQYNKYVKQTQYILEIMNNNNVSSVVNNGFGLFIKPDGTILTNHYDLFNKPLKLMFGNETYQVIMQKLEM
jgi:exodeoxyribonuclease VII large subunit